MAAKSSEGEEKVWPNEGRDRDQVPGGAEGEHRQEEVHPQRSGVQFNRHLGFRMGFRVGLGATSVLGLKLQT